MPDNSDSEMPTFTAETELEEHLAAAQSGELDSIEFLQHLANAQVFIAISEDVARQEEPTSVEPLVLLGPEDTPMLAVFTLSDRAGAVTGEFPDFGFTLEVPFSWVVTNCREDMGIVVNPGWPVGATLPPEAVRHMQPEE